MNSKFGIFLSDFKLKKNILLKVFKSRENALEYLTNYSYLFILNKEGEIAKENFKIRREPSSLISNTFTNYPFGYFICYSTDSYYRNTIYLKKKIEGYFVNSFEIEKILSIDIIEIKEKKKKDIEYDNFLMVDKEIYDHYNKDVLPELLLSFSKEIIS